METKIEKLDNFGRGITYVNSKITFVYNALPDEVVKIKIVKENKKYNEAVVLEYIVKSNDRIEVKCPYFAKCGGCRLLNLEYEKTLEFKKDKLENILLKYAGIKKDVEVISSDNILNYRNKVTLKVYDGNYGYYEENSHNLVKIDKCLLAEESINNFLKDFNLLNIKNGEVVVRANYNDELLINIISKDDLKLDVDKIKENNKLVGIVINGNCIYGEDNFVEIINGKYFVVSYDSFFQVNRNICSKLFNFISSYIDNDKVVLDLYCGVGTLGLNIAKRSKKVYGIEIVKNAILNAIKNAKINKVDNAYYMLGDVGSILKKISDKIDTVILDPPRAGLDKLTKEKLVEFKPEKIIYVSCDSMTLARDLKELSSYYEIIETKGFDMFPFTYHCESVVILERKK